MIAAILCVLPSERSQRLYGNQSSAIVIIAVIECFQRLHQSPTIIWKLGFKNVRRSFETLDTWLLDALCEVNIVGKHGVRERYSKWLWRKNSQLTRSIVIRLPANQGSQVTEIKLCIDHSWSLSSLNLQGLMVKTQADLKRNFLDLRGDHHSSPAGEIYLYKFALIDRLQDIPCITHGKFLLDLHLLNF